jgi:hypothetical protein
MIGPGLIHSFAELALWLAAFYLAGCPVGALARGLWNRRRKPVIDAEP